MQLVAAPDHGVLPPTWFAVSAVNFRAPRDPERPLQCRLLDRADQDRSFPGDMGFRHATVGISSVKPHRRQLSAAHRRGNAVIRTAPQI
jgi:hypothetical protein